MTPELLIALTVILPGTYLAVSLIMYILRFSMAWLDDRKIKQENVVGRLFLLAIGYKEDEGDWLGRTKYEHKFLPKFDGSCKEIFISLGLAALPMTLVVLWALKTYVLMGLSFLFLMFTARAVRRLFKRFDLHTKDPQAHNRSLETEENP